MEIISFDSCRTLNKDLQDNTTYIISWIIIGIYCLTEILYSIVILRLFVPNVMRLAVINEQVEANNKQYSPKQSSKQSSHKQSQHAQVCSL